MIFRSPTTQTTTAARWRARLGRFGGATAGAVAVNGVILVMLMTLNAPPDLQPPQRSDVRIAMHQPPPPEPAEPEPEPEPNEPEEPEQIEQPLDRPTPEISPPAPTPAPLDLPTFDVASPEVAIRSPSTATDVPTDSSVSSGEGAAAAGPRGPMDADAADEPGRAIRHPQPEYPRVALRRSVTGHVSARVLVDREGRVERVDITEVQGHAAFESSVRRALLNTWRYSPTLHQGQPVRAWHQVTIRFELD